MKILKGLAAALVVILIGLGMCASLTGCGAKAQPLSPAQIAAVACPQLDLVHTQLTVLNTALEADPATAAIGAKGAAQLAAIQPIVSAVCKGALASPTVDASSIATFVQTGLPALATLVGSLPLPPAQEAQAQAALVLAETAVGVAGLVEQQIKAAQAAPAAVPLQ